MSLGAKHGKRSHEHRPAGLGIADDGNVEFFAGADDGITDPVPVRSSTIAEVHVDLSIEISVEAEFGIDDVKPGLTAVAKYGLPV